MRRTSTSSWRRSKSAGCWRTDGMLDSRSCDSGEASADSKYLTKVSKLIPDSPVVAVTIARMKMFQVPRFLQWGRPVEKLVRDHPGTTLSLASIRYPRTISTFSIWKSMKEMTDMVRGHSSVPEPKRHIDAMKERDRKDFHFEFTTLRFKPISEFGEWNGSLNIVPGLD